jgi:hypothetical protein
VNGAVKENGMGGVSSGGHQTFDRFLVGACESLFGPKQAKQAHKSQAHKPGPISDKLESAPSSSLSSFA